jgi:cytochrome c-type biogenesis protein CcmH/NrfG
MMNTNSSALKYWTNQRALILMAICLMAGIAGGWVIRGGAAVRPSTTAKVASVPTSAVPSASPAAPAPDPAQLKAMADSQAAPQLLKLKSDPKNPELLTSIGNMYYDAQQYQVAIDYYARVLEIKPAEAAVRTDMATAYWYLGNADTAIAEFNKALTYAPNNPNTLFNLGLVKWQGKHDGAAAIADWKKLLANNPTYEGKDKLEQMLADVEKQTGVATK